MNLPPDIAKEVIASYRRYTLADSINNSKVACVLVMTLMPFGYVMDRFVYPDKAPTFLLLRLLSSCFAGLVFVALLRKGWSDTANRVLCTGWYLVPSVFICTMIVLTNGLSSTYYAGLNLVILAVSSVIQATFVESIVAVSIILTMYILACVVSKAPFNPPMAFNNGFFVFCTSAIVITGNYFYNRLRFQEFALRFELDKNRKALESSLQQLKETEMQLVQSEKLASLGRMSAGIIHEINNPLNFATTGLYLLRNKRRFLAPEQQEEYVEIVNDVEEGIKRVTTIVSDLRTFSHPDAGQRDEVEVAEVVAAALRFVSNEWKNLVQIDTTIAPEQTIWVNKNKFIHVLVNLLQNSLDAMKEKSFDGEKPAIQITGRVENGRSVLSIRDNGPGIDAKHLDKVFDPFYTTKEVGAGMGLGLSICHRIVQENGGKISVITEPGRFCEFTLEFPEKG